MKANEIKMLRHKHTLRLLTQAAAKGSVHAAGILRHLEMIEAEMEALKVTIESVHDDPDTDRMSRQYFASQDKILVSLIALERQRRVILRAVKANNLPTVLNFIIPGLVRRRENVRKKFAS